jgi:DNA-binding NtrC family response regulator
MDHGRILILGQSKETTYEIRNLVDNQRFELEIALSQEVGKQVLANRKMSLIMMHTEMLKGPDCDLFMFLEEKGLDIPVLVLGDQVDEQRIQPRPQSELHFFRKPYVSEEVITCIRNL